jgi:hypothetical protein
MAISRRYLLASAAAEAVLASGARADPGRVNFGSTPISRLVVGGNPVSGFSHSSEPLSNEMLDYFTVSNVKKLLRDCEQAGINAWQSRADRFVMRVLREYRGEGGRIEWIAQTASELGDINRNIKEIAAVGAIGAYNHGSNTDALWTSGKIETVHDRLKVMRQAGLRVGLGTHTPEVIDYAESKDWDVDFYMTCLYNLSRSKQDAEKLAGGTVEGEFFYEPDRKRMLERVRKASKQCLIFKVYGAGRRCRSQEDMRAALSEAFAYAKPSDVVVIGMFPKHKDQVTENCRLVQEAAAAAKGASGDAARRTI